MAWQRLAAVVPGTGAGALAEALEAAGAVSTETTDADAGTAAESAIFAEPGADAAVWPRCRLVALLPEGADARALLEAALAEAGCALLEPAAIDRLEDTDWVRETQRQFEPIRAGRRLWIVPTWHEAPDAGAVNIVLDPGAAFGTGSHPTTRLVLAWLEREVRGDEAVLDYGCGSGILAIAAMKLGAARAVAVDIDPLALEAARYNASANAVAVEALAADAPLALEADLTVANILANPLRMLAPLLASHTRPGGRIALSGVLAGQAGEVLAAYEPWFAMAVEATEGDWACLAGTRRGRG
ncbi:MAG: 50S ribosomal protein L11 methyltransferase [Burkholderiales bacterium]|nr:50S ribosomal protein L11 methyltransferase [Burkholderiales bacterium]MBX3715087.1 50S ribosomal protein L11 methyltransferase [Burkholderiales bacterium]